MRAISPKRQSVEKYGRKRSLRQWLLWKMHIENIRSAFKLFDFFIRISFTKLRGVRNALKIEVEEVNLSFANLPAAFDNSRILFLTDLHIDGPNMSVESIMSVVEKIDYDYCVLGGDYSYAGARSGSLAYRRMKELVKELVKKTKVYAVLGNHDYYSIAELLHQQGAVMLINETKTLIRGSDTIYFTGLDDCRLYEADDIELAGRARQGEFRMLICHSPERYKAAAKAGFALYLAGHTHGGQVCLPNGFAPVTGARVPRAMVKGSWRHRDMAGYTSRGVGTCGVSVRFFCPPEITLITLNRRS